MPRVGDGAAASHVHGSRTRAGLDDTGVSSLFRGASDIGTMRVVDSGYFFVKILCMYICVINGIRVYKHGQKHCRCQSKTGQSNCSGVVRSGLI